MILSWLKAYALQACTILLGVSSLFAGVQTWRLDNAQDELSTAIKKHKDELAEIDSKSKKVEAERRAAADLRQKSHIEIDRSFYKELTDAKIERDNLAAGIGSGKYRVYVRANCPSASGVPASGNGSGVDSGARAELDPEAGQLVSDIREGAKRLDAKLAACQEALRVELSR